MLQKTKSVAVKRGRWSQCTCANCLRPSCGTCANCNGKKNPGGSNKHKCEKRLCLTLHPPESPNKDENSSSSPAVSKPAMEVAAPPAVATCSTTDKIGIRTRASSQVRSEALESSSSRTDGKRKRAPSQIRSEALVLPAVAPKFTNVGVGKRKRMPSPIPSDALMQPKMNKRAKVVTRPPFHMPRRQCLNCPGCRTKDCKKCDICKGKTKYGGDNSTRATFCMARLCHVYSYRTSKQADRAASAGEAAAASSVKAATVAEPAAVQLPRTKKKLAPSKTAAETTTTTSSSLPIRRASCGTCAACVRDECGECARCLKKAKFGGDGQDKQICFRRRCYVLYPLQKRLDERMNDAAASEGGNNLQPADKKKQSGRSSAKDAIIAKPAEKQRCSIASTPTATQSEEAAVKPAEEIFTLSSYLAQPLVAVRDDPKTPAPVRTLYGLDIPNETASNHCSVCLGVRDDELEDQPVLLCDGLNCGREFHLACCVPELSAVPDVDHWLCQDCCPDGSTASLIQYFVEADSAKADYLRLEDPKVDFVQHLLIKDSHETEKPTDRIPESELERSAMTHALALCDSKHLARTRRGNEKREAFPAVAYLGKPIRIYNSLGNMYHTGRIVDYRQSSAATSSDAVVGKANEFLIRFTAGKDDRKKAYQHWIVLEEHALAVGSTLVWAQIPAGSWNPAILWLRTSRELVTIQHLLKESEGEIIYQDDKETYLHKPRKTKHKVCALARSFGEEQFSLINVRDQSVDLTNQESSCAYLKDPENVLQFQMANAELEEQKRVCSWRAMRQDDPVGPAVLSSRDSYTLPALLPAMRLVEHSNANSSHASLCPSIPRGLDRAKILKMLQRRGIDPTKDIAASLSCEIVPVNARTIELERMGRKLY